MSCSHFLIGLPLPPLPSTFASNMCFSSDSWRLVWLKYPSVYFFTFCRSVGDSIPIFVSTSLFVTLFVHGILRIFLQHFISNVVICMLSVMLLVHASHLYVAVGKTVLFKIRILVSMHCPFQIFVIFSNLDVAIASLLLISGVVFLFDSILAPRYSKLLTLSISSPSIFTMALLCTCLCPWCWSFWH